MTQANRVLRVRDGCKLHEREPLGVDRYFVRLGSRVQHGGADGSAKLHLELNLAVPCPNADYISGAPGILGNGAEGDGEIGIGEASTLADAEREGLIQRRLNARRCATGQRDEPDEAKAGEHRTSLLGQGLARRLTGCA